MDAAEAVDVLLLLDQVSDWKTRRSDAEWAEAAASLAAALDAAPDGWVITEARSRVARGLQPTIADLTGAWSREARRRISAVEIPPAPDGVDDDPARWLLWDRARRRALVRGATGEEAMLEADAAVGARRELVTVGGDGDAKAACMAQMREWAQRQHAAQAAIDEEVAR